MRRKRSNSISRCFLPATLHPARRRHISLKLLPLVQLPGTGVANVSVSDNLGRRLVSMVTAAAAAAPAGGGLSDVVPTRMTQLLSHGNMCSDRVCMCVCACARACARMPLVFQLSWAALLCLLLAFRSTFSCNRPKWKDESFRLFVVS